MTKIEEIKNKGLDVEWNMTIPADKINVILDKKYQELSQNVKFLVLDLEKFPSLL